MCSNADEGEKIFKYYLILEGYFMEMVPNLSWRSETG
jgi:hypothetical protein